MPKKYLIKPTARLLKDEASVRFHIKSGDYFGTIATVLGLIRQQISKDERSDASVLNKALDNLNKDLIFLQENYLIKEQPQISPKAKNKKRMPKGKLKSQ